MWYCVLSLVADGDYVMGRRDGRRAERGKGRWCKQPYDGDDGDDDDDYVVERPFLIPGIDHVVPRHRSSESWGMWAARDR